MKRIILLIVYFSLFLNLSMAQKPDSTYKPKIGLALSGGGAKGLAHIGVLKVLEEVGITPDYIAGTSMGAVVGSLYALGYSADEISEINRTIDWEFLLSDRIPLNEVVFEEKHEYKRFITGIPIRNYKFRLPSGVIEGQQLEKYFGGLTWPLHKLESFDSLSIPFRCMAVDLISGQSIEFNSGNLAESVRASMSIPSIFTPESIDTMLLVDGGLIRNLPVQEVKKMGADIVIAVYVGFEEKVTKEDLFSMSDVLSRATVFYGVFDSMEQMELADILIHPDLKGLGATDFTKCKRIEVLGEVAALELQDQLYQLADSFGLSYTPAKKLDQPERIYIEVIRVNNERQFVSDQFIINRSRIKPESYVTKHDLSEAVDRIFGTQYFKKVTYTLDKLSNGNYRVNFNVKESTRAFLNFAVHYDNQYGPGVITNLTLRNYLAPASRAIVSLNIAENPGLRMDINKYIGKNERIINNYFIDWIQNKNSLYENGFDVGTYSFSNVAMGIGGKYSFSVNQQIGALGFYEINKIYPKENIRNYYNVPSFDSYGYKGFAYKLYYSLNTTDDKFFPTRGAKLDLYYKYNFNPKVDFKVNSVDQAILDDVDYFDKELIDFYSAYVNLDVYTNVLKKFIVSVGGSAGISSNESAVLSNYVVGGFDNRNFRVNYVPFVGLNISEVIVPNYGLLKAGFDINIFLDVYLSARANMAFFTESKDDVIHYVMNSSLKSYYKGYSIGIRANTIIGPVNIMYSDNDFDGKVRWYVSVGYPF